ncbi:MAG: type 1 glutamine amidotransferase, partial [Planctomycetota bacterium]
MQAASLLLLASLVSAVFAPVAEAQASQQRIPVLLLTGANNHDWQWTAPSLKEILEESGRFKVSMTREPMDALEDSETLGRFAAVVVDYNGPRWGPQAEANFMAAVRDGLGVTIIHASNNSCEGWQEYESLVALNWRAGTGHGSFHPFDVLVEERDHPITRTLPSLLAHPDELYHKLAHLHDAPFTRLAGAYSDPKSGGTGEVEPMILVSQVGKGRIFHTPLGHVWPGVEASKVSHQDPQFRSLIVRGTEWAATGEVSDGYADANTLTPEQVEAGWRLLFNGKNLSGWRTYAAGEKREGWHVISGCLVRTGPAGDLVTGEAYSDFELAFEFQLSAGANSGMKYRVDASGGSALGPEYQVLDNTRHAQLPAKQKTASLYDVLPAPDAAPRAPGLWNQARVVAQAGHLEHWLNGKLVLSTDLDSEAWATALAASKFKGRAASFARSRGPILLQDHGDEVWYRNLRIRDLSAPSLREVPLLDEAGGLSGWTESGNAKWTREGNTVTGAVDGGGQSFLRTDQTFGDFVFEVDVK